MCGVTGAIMGGSALINGISAMDRAKFERNQAINNANRTNENTLENYKWDMTQAAGQKAIGDKSMSQTKQDTYLQALQAADTAELYASSMGTGGNAQDKILQDVTRQGYNTFGRLDQQQELGNLQYNTQLLSMQKQAENSMQNLQIYKPNPFLAMLGLGLNVAGGAMQGNAIDKINAKSP